MPTRTVVGMAWRTAKCFRDNSRFTVSKGPALQSTNQPSDRPTDGQAASLIRRAFYSLPFLWSYRQKRRMRILHHYRSLARPPREIEYSGFIPFKTRALVVFVLSISVCRRSSRSIKRRECALTDEEKKHKKMEVTNGSGKTDPNAFWVPYFNFHFPIVVWRPYSQILTPHTAHTQRDERETNSCWNRP